MYLCVCICVCVCVCDLQLLLQVKCDLPNQRVIDTDVDRTHANVKAFRSKHIRTLLRNTLTHFCQFRCSTRLISN